MNAAATWFLKSEDGQPLGQVYRDAGDPPDLLKARRSTASARWCGSRSLAASCGMRRFEVIVRPAAQPAV